MIERSGFTDSDLYERVYEAARGKRVIDVGAGLGPYHDRLVEVARRVLLVDPYRPYIANRVVKFGKRVDTSTIGIRDLIQPIGLGRFDLLLALDVVEHVTHDMGMDFLHAIPQLADRAIVFIPEGDHPQTTDAYGLGGDHWQTHRSTWYASDVEVIKLAVGQQIAGYEVERWLDFHVGKPCPHAIYATWGL